MRISDWSSDVCSSDLWGQDELLHETLIKGVNDEHLAVTIDRLKQRYGVVVDTRRPSVAYKESVRKPVTQRGRHKKQSGGHGQFGDVVIEVRRSEEHTSELQSLMRISYAVFCLKKTKKKTTTEKK